MPAPKNQPINKVNQETYALVFKALLTEPQSLDNLEELTGLHRVTLYRLFRTLKKHKVVHVVEWEQDRMGRDMFPVFAIGHGKDKPKFRMSRTEIARRYRERKKQKKVTEVLDNIIKGVKNAEHPNPEECTA